MAVTTPELLPTVATAGVLLLHPPPVTVLPKDDVPPTHSVVMPVTVPAEIEFTVTLLTAAALPQPEVTE